MQRVRKIRRQTMKKPKKREEPVNAQLAQAVLEYLHSDELFLTKKTGTKLNRLAKQVLAHQRGTRGKRG